MHIKKLNKELCGRMGLTNELHRAQVSEIVGHLSDIVYAFEKTGAIVVVAMLFKNGQRRAKGKK